MRRTLEHYYNFDTMKLIDSDGENLSTNPFVFVFGDNAFCYNIKIGLYGATPSNKVLSGLDEFYLTIGNLGTSSPLVSSGDFQFTGTWSELPYITFTNQLSAGKFTVFFNCDNSAVRTWSSKAYEKTMYLQIYVRNSTTGADGILVRHPIVLRNNILES
jgi:hypothetical protein